MIDLEEEISKLQVSLSIIDYNYELFIAELDKEIFKKLDFELVVYDEIEQFMSYDDAEFDYPYSKRKN